MKTSKKQIIHDINQAEDKKGSLIKDIRDLSIAELIEKYAYAEAIVETVREPLVILDGELRIKTINKSFLDTFERKKEETFGKYLFKLNSGEWNIPELRKLLEDILPKNTVFNNFEVTHDFERIGRKTMILNARRIILEENKTELILLAIEDITQRRIFEQQKDDLINIVSHELKTPLTSVKMFAQSLLKQLKDDSRAQPLLAKINDQVDKLITLVAQILDTTRIEQGKLKLKREKFILKDEAREIIQNLQVITDHNLIFDWQTSEYLYADKALIRQVFTNFITNAIKYSHGKKDIIIRSQKSNDNIIVSVQDFGKGIPKAEQARIFDRFYQIRHNRSTNLSLGLGLYISKQIVTQLGGKIWVESEEGKGSTFFFSLPIYKKQK